MTEQPEPDELEALRLERQKRAVVALKGALKAARDLATSHPLTREQAEDTLREVTARPLPTASGPMETPTQEPRA